MILYRDERIHGETGASIRGLNARIKVQSEKRDSIRAQRAYLRSAFDPLPFGDKRKSRPVLRAMLTAIIGIVTFAARARARASERVREIRFQLLPSESDFFSYLAETKFRVSTSIIRFRAGDI